MRMSVWSSDVCSSDLILDEIAVDARARGDTMAMQHDAWVDLLLVRSPSRVGDVATQRPARGHYVWTAWPRGARQPRDCRLTFTLGASMTALSRLRSRR